MTTGSSSSRRWFPDPVAAKKTKTLDLLHGFVAECLVMAYAILGAAGRLDGFRPGTDVDHKDIIFDEIGGYCSAYLQVKCTTYLNEGIRVQCQAHYHPDTIPSDPRFVYAFCLLDLKAMDLSRIWLVPSPAFNKLAYRFTDSAGRVDLTFSAKVSGDPKWDKYEVDKQTLGPRLLEIATAPTKRRPIKDLDLGAVLVLRASATPSR